MAKRVDRLKGTFKSKNHEDWFTITVDKHQLAVVMAGLRALTKYESDQLLAPEQALIKQMYDSMATVLGEAVMKDKSTGE